MMHKKRRQAKLGRTCVFYLIVKTERERKGERGRGKERGASGVAFGAYERSPGEF